MDTECKELNGLIEDDIKEIEKNEELIEGKLNKDNKKDSQENLVTTNQIDNLETINTKTTTNKIENSGDNHNRNNEQIFENGKRKIKEEKPPTKVVVRRLPPSMTKEIFLEQVSPLPTYDYMYFINGDPSYGIYSFSRAYLNFINQEDVFTFTRTFDNYVFLDAKGQEYPAIVEFAPFQRVPKQRSKKKDTLTGTIESDPMYISFKENLLAEALENSKPGAKSVKQHYFETEISTTEEEVNTTPLLEYLKQRRAEKARVRDERREEKKRKEAERKLKQKTKEKKTDADEEEINKDVKVLQSKDRRDSRDKDIKGLQKKDEKVKVIKENRTREFKNRSGKSYQEERIRQAERREERKKENNNNTGTKHNDNKEAADNVETSTASNNDDNKNRTPNDKKRIYENNKKKLDSDDWKNNGDGGSVGDQMLDKRMKTDRNRGERRQRERERKRREEFASRKGYDKKIDNDKKKVKSYKMLSTVEYNKENKNNKSIIVDNKNETPKTSVDNQKNPNELNQQPKKIEVLQRRRKSLESGDFIEIQQKSNENFIEEDDRKKRRNSLESGKISIKSKDGESPNFIIKSKSPKKDVEEKETKNKSYMSDRKIEIGNDENKVNDRKNSEQSMNNGDTGSSKNKDPRTDRRIRNKDRPSLQIYRPGMGKFSKQRLEKEKVLGSSTEVESPSHSPSPTPKAKFPA